MQFSFNYYFENKLCYFDSLQKELLKFLNKISREGKGRRNSLSQENSYEEYHLNLYLTYILTHVVIA